MFNLLTNEETILKKVVAEVQSRNIHLAKPYTGEPYKLILLPHDSTKIKKDAIYKMRNILIQSKDLNKKSYLSQTDYIWYEPRNRKIYIPTTSGFNKLAEISTSLSNKLANLSDEKELTNDELLAKVKPKLQNLLWPGIGPNAPPRNLITKYAKPKEIKHVIQKICRKFWTLKLNKTYFSQTDFIKYKGTKYFLPSDKGFLYLETFSENIASKPHIITLKDKELMLRTKPKLLGTYWTREGPISVSNPPYPIPLDNAGDVRAALAKIYDKFIKLGIAKTYLSKTERINYKERSISVPATDAAFRKIKEISDQNKKFIQNKRILTDEQLKQEIGPGFALYDIYLLKKDTNRPYNPNFEKPNDIKHTIITIYNKINSKKQKNRQQYFSKNEFIVKQTKTRKFTFPVPIAAGLKFFTENCMKKRKINNVENPTMPPEKRRKITPLQNGLQQRVNPSQQSNYNNPLLQYNYYDHFLPPVPPLPVQTNRNPFFNDDDQNQPPFF